MSNSQCVGFESLPFIARNEIYRYLLVKPFHGIVTHSDDDPNEVVDLLEVIFTDCHIDPVYGEESELHPAILRTSKMIHQEAIKVLWGENYFMWDIDGRFARPMWHAAYDGDMTPIKRVSTRCSRLIKNIQLDINVRGSENDLFQKDAVVWALRNVEYACEKLCLNDLKILKVEFINSLGYERGRNQARYCLVPLKNLRARRVSSPRYAAYSFQY